MNMNMMGMIDLEKLRNRMESKYTKLGRSDLYDVSIKIFLKDIIECMEDDNND